MHSSRMRTVRNCSRLLGGGVPGPGGGGCLLVGDGACSWGCLLLAGVCSWGGGSGIPACTEADPAVDRHTIWCNCMLDLPERPTPPLQGIMGLTLSIRFTIALILFDK